MTVTPVPPPKGVSLVVYKYESLMSPILQHWTTDSHVTVMYGNVDKPELRFGDSTQVLIPKSWDILQVQTTSDYVRVIVRTTIRGE